MAWFLAEQAVSDLASGLSREEFMAKYAENHQGGWIFRFGHEPAKREEADHDKRGGSL